MKKVFYFLLVLAVVGILFFYFSREKISQVTLGDAVITVEVVDTPESRNLGLSGRENLAENTGMLFIFPKSGHYDFWMKDMNFAIDIIWMDEDREVIHIEHELGPETFPEAFGPKEETSRYVLEVSSGFARRHNIQLGQIALFSLD